MTTMLFPGVAQVRISNRVQVRYTDELPDDAVTLPGTGGPGDSLGSFRIRRAKFKIDGWFYKQWLLYELQLNWPAATGANPAAFVEDANINLDLTKGDRKFMVKFGQYKVPFGQQQLTSSGSQQFVDRSHRLRHLRPRARRRDPALGTAAGRQDRVARRGVQRERPHPHRQRQRQVPVQRAA